MRMIVTSFFFVFGIITTCKAQEDILQVQEIVVNKFIHHLELKEIDSAMLLLDSYKAKDQINLRKRLATAIKDIENIPKGAFPLTMLVKNNRENIYRCRYINEKDQYPEFYQVDIFFEKNGQGEIGKVEFYNRKALIQEQSKRKKNAANVPPAPPVIKQ